MSNFASGYIKYINHLEQINDAAIASPAKMVEEVEGSYREHLRNIARNITERRTPVRIVMLSGPSSSGKTTTISTWARTGSPGCRMAARILKP